MSEARGTARVSRGAATLRRLLDEQTFDVRTLDLAGFRDWLARHLARWERDPIFAQRARLRDLRRGRPDLRALEQARRLAVRADEASAASERLRRLSEELRGAEKAVAGLGAALKSAAPARRAERAAKLKAFRARRRELKAEEAAVARASAERRELKRVEGRLRRLRAELGLDAEEARLAALLAARGRRSGRSGDEFEATAEEAVRSEVVPEVTRRDRAGRGRPVRILRGVTLGAAKVELDQVVVWEAGPAGGAVEVLAVVEAKRNANDLAHGFRRRQEDLGWLTGDAGGFDAADWRTKTFPRGRFDRVVFHKQAGESFAFGPGSFRRFEREAGTGRFLDRLYFVTQAGPVWGLSAAALGRIAHRVATDVRWRPEEEDSLDGLFGWCRAQAGAFETPEVLRLFAEARQGRQVIVSGARGAGGTRDEGRGTRGEGRGVRDED